jgi:hypothetical protein
MKKLLLLGVAAVALTAAVPAQAQSTFTGECGLVRTINATTLPPMTLAVAADYVHADDMFVPMRAEFGVIEGLEVGANYWFVDNDFIDGIVGANAKYRLPLQFVEGLGIAVGVNYQFTSLSEGDDLSALKLTAVASYDIPAGPVTVTPSAGMLFERDSNGDSENGVRFFANVLAMVMPNLGVGGEIMTTVDKLDGDGADPYMWFGARFMPLENLSVQAGVLNNANYGGDQSDWTFHLGAGYAFSFAQ